MLKGAKHVSAGLFGGFTIFHGLKPSADGGMPEVGPLADMPWTNLMPAFELLQFGREPADPKIGSTGKMISAPPEGLVIDEAPSSPQVPDRRDGLNWITSLSGRVPRDLCQNAVPTPGICHGR